MSVLFTYFKKASTLFLVVAFVSGCAPSSKNIEAAYVSPLQYQSYDCNQIGIEMSRVGRKVSEVSGQQDNVAGKDAAMMGVGLVVFWPALFFLAAGENRKEELARLKGEADALEQTAINKQCHEVIAQIEEARKLHEEKEVATSLVDAKRQECIDTLGKSACAGRDFEAEVRQEPAGTEKSKEKQTTASSSKDLENLEIKSEPIVHPQEQSSLKTVQEEDKREYERLVEEELERCNLITNDHCDRDEIEKQISAEQKKLKKAEVANLLEDKSENVNVQGATVQPQLVKKQSDKSEVFRAKCTKCGDVVSYQAKYIGKATTCMQCDNHFTLP